MNIKNDYSYCSIVSSTDVGCKRAANEDFLGQQLTKNGLVAVVCDGMGGHVGGATASHIAVDTILAFLDNQFIDDPRVAIERAIDAANQAILCYAEEHPELRGMGSTCVLLIVRDGLVYYGHVGDSRIYLVRNHTIVQLTTDHSYVQMLVDAGQITHEQAEHHPRKNEITNALGIPSMQSATVVQQPVSPEVGDCFVLCSDGLSGMVSDDRINNVVSKQWEMRAQERADQLIDMAKKNGGLDNITVELVEFASLPNKKTSCILNKRILYFSVTAVVLLIIIALIWYSNIEGNRQPVEQNNEVPTNVNDNDSATIIEPSLPPTSTIKIAFSKPIKYSPKGEVCKIEVSYKSTNFTNTIDTYCQVSDSLVLASISYDVKQLSFNTADKSLCFAENYEPSDSLKIYFSLKNTSAQKSYEFEFIVDKKTNKQQRIKTSSQKKSGKSLSSDSSPKENHNSESRKDSLDGSKGQNKEESPLSAEPKKCV